MTGHDVLTLNVTMETLVSLFMDGRRVKKKKEATYGATHGLKM